MTSPKHERGESVGVAVLMPLLCFQFSPPLHALFSRKVKRAKELHSALTEVATPKLVINPRKKAPPQHRRKHDPNFSHISELSEPEGNAQI